ncbi:protein tyrosine phosphatase [Trypanosoma conorhini]|uniref:very-long-chain (3R)-3-hydroxyacyl-CoA dehydratase n=1 Tax=Trypanosoma conorhini TaxID=83891 RepID=A0A3R7MBI2_9TRYP|nr:protein tyrosine phosphatase [Trypanosoma conorhini]RNF02841.1 protein tyrosine phosphatase [Trypanosoma conorhini]
MESLLKKAYLLAYNGSMFTGWAVILAKIVRHLASGKSIEDVYPLIAKLLVFFQGGAVMEVLHAILGLVRAPIPTTVMQVSSRLVVLFGALQIGPTEARSSPCFTQMVVAWSLSEVIRYAYYATNLLDVKSKPLTWLRYSAFTLLYPVGITGEIGCFYRALPYIKANKPWSMELPNRYNWTFSWYNTVWFILLGLYPYGSYVMYTYMLQQRRKVLSAAKSPAPPAKKAARKHSGEKANKGA